MNNIITTKCV